MSNSFRGQTQYMQSPMGFGGGGYGDPYISSGGGYGYASSPFGGGYGQSYGSPFGSSLGGYGTSFGGMGMGGGYGQPAQQSLVPQYQPTINDLFSQYFSQQYYGGQAFNPFAATSLFGGGYGGGYGGGGFGGGGRGMGGRMRRRRQMFEDLFGPEQPTAQPAPMPQPPVQDFPYAIRRPTEPMPQPIATQPAALPEPMAQPAVEPYSQPIQPYFGGLPIDFGYSAPPVASAQPAPYMPTYQSVPMSVEDMMLAREAIRSGAFSAL